MKMKILIAEHDIHDLLLIQNELKRGGIDYIAEFAQNEAEYRKTLKNFTPDIIFCDYSFPSFDGPTAFKIREEEAPETPFILVSGTIGEENSIELIKNGVTDFVLKDKLFTLNTKLVRALREAKEQKEKSSTKKELALSESLLARAQQVAQLGSWELNFDDNAFRLSVEGSRIFGFPPDQNRLSFKTWSSLVDPDDIDEVLQTIKEARESLMDTSYHHRIILKDGTVRHIYSESKPEFDENGKVVGLYGTMQDVTERKKNEAAINKAYTEKNLVLESIDDGFFATDKNSLVTYWNKKAEKLLGKKKEDVIGKNLHEVFDGHDNNIFYDNYQKAIRDHNTVRFEAFSTLSNKWFAVSAFASDNGLSVYFKDVTEQKNDEEKIKESELRYRSIIEQATDAICIADASMKIIDINPYGCQMLGYSKAEFLQLSVNELFLPEDLLANPFKIDELRSGKVIRNERRFKSKDGTLIDVEMSGRILADGRFIVFGHDIAERKITEQQSEFDRNNLNALINNTSDLMWSVDKNCRLITFNQPFFDLIRFVSGKELAKGDDIFSVVLSADQHGRFKISYDRALSGEAFTEVEHIETPVESWSEISYYPILNGTEIIGTACHSRDISERKKAEQLLSIQEKRYRALVENGADAVVILSAEGKPVYASPTLEKVLGYTEVEALQLDLFSMFHPDDIVWAIEIWEQVMMNPGIPVPVHPSRMIHKDGTWRWLEGTVTNLLHDPSIQGIVDNFRDVTGKKELENLLNKTNSLARIGSWEVDLVKNSVYWSDITKEIHEVEHGYIPDLQNSISFYKEGESRDLIAKKVKDAIENGSSWDIELQIITVKGNEKWIRSIGEAEFLNGKAVSINGSFQDIDIRKRAELGVKEVLEEKNSILESIGDAFFAVDDNWIVTYWNNHAESMLGVSKNEILARNLWDVFRDSIDSESYIKYHEAVKTRRMIHFEDYYQVLNKWFEISAYPSDSGLSVYFKDVTKRKHSDIHIIELNENLQKQTKELAISNADLEQFAYVASHDLQEPLRMVTSFLTQLQKKYATVIDDKGKQYIEFAVDGAKRMRQIILDLLEFSRVGRTEDMQENIDLNELVEEIQILFRKQVLEKKAIIISNPLPIIPGYRSPMRQVFQNLISNALKYTKKEQATRINITCTALKDHWQFAVNDNGIGIEQEYFDKIFIIFQRLHNKNEFSGTGMGLAITKKIIENHGGKIWLESEEGKGSTFYFTIPKAIAI